MLKVGEIDLYYFLLVEVGMLCLVGICNMMGIVLMMVCMVEVFGVVLLYNVVILVVDLCCYVFVYMLGICIVEMVFEGFVLLKVLMCVVFENVICVNVVIGGLINVVIYLKVIVGCIGVLFELEDWMCIGCDMLMIVDLMLLGCFLMEEFYYVGGLLVVLCWFGEGGLLLYLDVLMVNGKLLWDNVCEVLNYDDEVICLFDWLLIVDGGICILCGNFVLCGVVLKLLVVSFELFKYCGCVVVFENFDYYKVMINDEVFDVDVSLVMVLKNCGLCGYLGMVEVGNMGLLLKLLC